MNMKEMHEFVKCESYGMKLHNKNLYMWYNNSCS